MRFEDNDFSQITAFPPDLRMFKASDNPQMLATGSEVADLLKTAPKLYDFSFGSNTIASRTRANGEIAVPPIGWTEMTRCHSLPIWRAVRFHA